MAAQEAPKDTDRRDMYAMIATVRAAAAEAGSYVVDVVLSLNDAKIPVAGIGADELAAMIRAVGCP